MILNLLITQQTIKNTYTKLLFLKGNFKLFLVFYFLFSFFTFDLSKSETNDLTNLKNNQIDIEYLESRNELEDYIIDTGDVIYLDFFPAAQYSGNFPVNEEGELFLPEIDKTFVRGLTTSELKNLLEERYAEFLIDPEIKVRISVFKQIRILMRGELRNPGFYKFPAYLSGSLIRLNNSRNSDLEVLRGSNNEQLEVSQNSNSNIPSSENLIVKRSSDSITTLSDGIRKAGGITSYTDLSQVEIIRDIPLGKGGGKKRAIIDFSSYLNGLNPTKDIRLFDGDILFFPKLSKNDPTIISKSILTGLSPRFISVNIFGRVDQPGIVKLPLEAVLSDAIDLTGPIKPLSGKIVLIRYNQDGKVLKKKISYSAKAKRGSKQNPFLKDDDLITVKNSFLGTTTSVIKELTEPFIGIYSTKELIEGFND